MQSYGGCSRRCQRQACIAFFSQLRIQASHILAFCYCGAVLVDGHCFSLAQSFEHREAHLGGIAVTIGIQGPAHLPGINRVRERSRVDDGFFEGSDSTVVVMPNDSNTAMLDTVDDPLPPGGF